LVGTQRLLSFIKQKVIKIELSARLANSRFVGLQLCLNRLLRRGQDLTRLF
jgi:hypothetical protein